MCRLCAVWLHVHVFMIPYCAVVGVYVSSILHFHITLHYALVGVCRGVALVSFLVRGGAPERRSPPTQQTTPRRNCVGTNGNVGNLGWGSESEFPTGLLR